tara:strand:+ start:126 stop:677 length:552 start_codon:yes stop_codon:yes gene_type:complete
MPDIPIDTLIILLLVLASLIGRIFQKKNEGEQESAPTTKSFDAEEKEEHAEEDQEIDLGEAMRDFWRKAQESAQPQAPTETNYEPEEAPPPPKLSQAPSKETVLLAPPHEEWELETAVSRKIEEAQQKVERGPHEGAFDQINKENIFVASLLGDLKSENTLRKAFLIREILGKPTSLKKDWRY